MSRVVAIVLLFLYTLQGYPAQQPSSDSSVTLPGSRPDSGPPLSPEIQKNMQKKANEQRQAELKRDTDKLVKLSTELKAYVDKTNENVLSLDVIKKADEIERLAHSVKTKMRGSN